MGVTEFQMGDMKIFFSPPKESWTNRRTRNATGSASAIKREGEDDIEQAKTELYLSQLAIDDPEEFERLSIKGLNG